MFLKCELLFKSGIFAHSYEKHFCGSFIQKMNLEPINNKGGEENKRWYKSCQNGVQQLYYKGFFFSKLLKLACETLAFRGTQFEYHSLISPILLRHFRRNPAAVSTALIDFKLNIYIRLFPNCTLKFPSSNSILCNWMATLLSVKAYKLMLLVR